MRRTARNAGKALGACAAAALLALAGPTGTAQAAAGVLIIDGTEHLDPQGCYRLGDFAPPRVANHTDEVVWVWSGPNCDGRVTEQIDRGAHAVARGRSVYID